MIALSLLVFAGQCLAYNPGDPEFRGFWVDAWGAGIQSQSQVNTLLGVVGDPNSKGQIRDANCNALVIQVRRNCDANYPSSMGEPYMGGLSPSNFNGLQAAINAAHDTTGGKKRIEVHAWIVTFRTSGGTVYSQHDDTPTGSLTNLDNYWPSRDNNGAVVGDKAFDPGHPLAEEYTVNVAMDLVNNFDIDGIHYDYVRFTYGNQGYNPTSIARYNARYGLTGQPSPTDDQFDQWRRDQVSAVVRKVYGKVQASKPWVKQTGAFVTWNPSPTASTRAAFQTTRPYGNRTDGVFCDWDSWLQEGIVDAAIPMTYYDLAGSYPNDWTKWIKFEKDRHGARHMYIGPGIYMNSLPDAITELQQTRTASPAGNYADGFCGYSYRVPYVSGTWSGFSPSLVSGVTPTWADVPAMPWKTSPTKGHISGTVTIASTGKWADGATVSVTGPQSKTQTCDGNGYYAFIDLTPGAYAVTATLAGYTSEVRTVNVAVGSVTGNMYVTDIAFGAAGPPVISNVSSSGIGLTGATIAWNTDQTADTQVDYGLTSTYTWSTAPAAGQVSSHSVAITDLNPNTLYHYRVRSANVNGSASSADYTFTTTSGMPVDTIVDESGPGWTRTGGWTVITSLGGRNNTYEYCYSRKTGSTATCTWTPNLPRTGPYDVYYWYTSRYNHTAAVTYTINYSGGSTTRTLDQRSNGGQWVLLAGGLQFAAGTSGLVTFNNVTGEPDGGALVVADAIKWHYTGDMTPPSVPQNLVATVASTTSMSLNWTASTDNIGVTGYKIYRNSALVGTSATTSYPDSGLTANTQYSYTVSACDAIPNESAQSSAVSKYTLSTPPTSGIIICNKPAGGWSDTASFVLGNNGFGAGKVASYRYVWDGSPTHTWTGAETSWTTMNKVLMADTTTHPFYFHVKGYNGDGVANGTLDLGPYNYGIVYATIAAAMNNPDGSGVIISPNKAITAVFGNSFYVEEADRTRGIRVDATTALAVGKKVKVGGRLSGSLAERSLIDAAITDSADGTAPLPLFTRIADLGGASPDLHTSGLAGAKGAYNIGLLVRVAGVVKSQVSGSFVLDDGSGATVKVYSDKAVTDQSFVGATGTSTIEGGQRVVRTRSQEDVKQFAP